MKACSCLVVVRSENPPVRNRDGLFHGHYETVESFPCVIFGLFHIITYLCNI